MTEHGSPDWPSDLAWELLEEFEDDPVGLGWMDIQKLLEVWEITEPLRGEDLGGYRARTHRNLPQYIVYYPMLPELSSAAVQNICRAVRELHRRLSS